jgi:methylmalonyl-CoA/ethylmalonyl-CoA epimerase
MKVKKINHIGIAVAESGPVLELYTHLLGLPLRHEEMLGELKIAFVSVGETNLELVQSTDPEGVMAKYVASGVRSREQHSIFADCASRRK